MSFRLALLACGLALVVLALGAFTRLADAGLGCPDWPTCYGHLLWPTTSEHIRAANQAYPDMPVLTDKTWPEMVHRYAAASLGLIAVILVTFAIYLRCQRQNLHQPLLLPIMILSVVIIQGLFGMWTVTLKLWPQVVTAHLLGGFTTLTLFWLFVLRYHRPHWSVDANTEFVLKRLRPWGLLGLLIVVIQVALGGWTTANYAAVACPDLPTCQDQWLPTMDFAKGFDVLQHIGPNYLGGTMDNAARTAIHFSHRMGAMITAIYWLTFGWQLYRRTHLPSTKGMAGLVIAIVILQMLLGLGNIYFHFPMGIAIAHHLTAALLLLTVVTLNYQFFTAQTGAAHRDITYESL